MAGNRVVSLAPSATATLVAMDAADRVVAATDHCAVDAPSVGGWLTPDVAQVEAFDPDLVLTTDALQDRIRADLAGRGLAVHHLDPRTLEDVLSGFVDLGEAVGCPDAGRTLRQEARERLAAVRACVEGRPRPTVYCEEWGDPPMAAGNWVPEAVEVAGGRYPFVDPGERSRPVSRETVQAAEPDYVVVHHCGRGTDVDPDLVAVRGWSLPAVGQDRVHVVEDSRLNQPSPRLIYGIETLAGLLHPQAAADRRPAPSG